MAGQQRGFFANRLHHFPLVFDSSMLQYLMQHEIAVRILGQVFRLLESLFNDRGAFGRTEVLDDGLDDSRPVWMGGQRYNVTLGRCYNQNFNKFE